MPKTTKRTRTRPKAKRPKARVVSKDVNQAAFAVVAHLTGKY